MFNFSILYIAVVQLGFSALDIYARSNLRGAETFISGMSKEWLVVWLFLQACIAPFQIRLIVQNGLGKGVALMNGFSVLFALIGGYIFLNEPIHWNHIVSVVSVIVAVLLFATAKPKHPHVSSPEPLSPAVSTVEPA